MVLFNVYVPKEDSKGAMVFSSLLHVGWRLAIRDPHHDQKDIAYYLLRSSKQMVHLQIPLFWSKN